MATQAEIKAADGTRIVVSSDSPRARPRHVYMETIPGDVTTMFASEARALAAALTDAADRIDPDEVELPDLSAVLDPKSLGSAADILTADIGRMGQALAATRARLRHVRAEIDRRKAEQLAAAAHASAGDGGAR